MKKFGEGGGGKKCLVLPSGNGIGAAKARAVEMCGATTSDKTKIRKNIFRY